MPFLKSIESNGVTPETPLPGTSPDLPLKRQVHDEPGRHSIRSRERKSGKGADPVAPGAEHSAHAQAVARWFELTLDEADAAHDAPVPDTPIPSPQPGQIMLITGPSGAGKSSTMRRLRAAEAERAWRDVAAVAWGDGLVIDQFGDDVEAALRTLGRFGLGEAHTYLCPPGLLSDGQQWRLRLARAVHDATDRPTVLAADEFAAVLDRLTAVVVARALRRAVDAMPNACAVVATGHDDLERALSPDVIVRCDFGRVTVEPGRERKREEIEREGAKIAKEATKEESEDGG